MQLAFSSFETRVALALLTVLLVFPLFLVLLSGDFAYYLNVMFYSQKTFLTASLMLFVLLIAYRERTGPKGWELPDADDAVSCALVSFALVVMLGILHVNFDTLLKMEVVHVAKSSMWIGSGSLLADSFDIDRIPVDGDGISKVIVVKNQSGMPSVLRLNTGWDGPADFLSNVTLSVNGAYKLDLTRNYSSLRRGEPSVLDISIPAHALREGDNVFEFRSQGQSGVFLTGQWVYHDAKTLRTDGSYYGEEALVYLREPPPVPRLFRLVFDYQVILKLLAVMFLLLALFGKDALLSFCARNSLQLLALFVLCLIAVNIIGYIQTQWQHLSVLTGEALSGLLGRFLDLYSDFSDPAGPVLGTHDFYIRIFKNCSGIESMAVFMLLFIAMVTFNGRHIHVASLPLLFVLGLAGTFLVNVMRLACLVLVGAFFSSSLAVNAFHTNLGWMLMLFYFAGFNELSNRFFRRENHGN